MHNVSCFLELVIHIVLRTLLGLVIHSIEKFLDVHLYTYDVNCGQFPKISYPL